MAPNSPAVVTAPSWTPSFAAVERFIRDVLPTVPGGRHMSTDSRGHLALIRHAAVDRGLTVDVDGRTTRFYDGKLAVGEMRGWVPSLVGRDALAISKAKDRTKELMAAAGLPVPAGLALDADQFDRGLAHLRATDRPQVLKPVTAKGGAGITCGITTADELRAAWSTAERAMEKAPRFVLEELVEGVDLRVYVVGSRVVAAATRVNCHVVGDGRQSMAELIDEKLRWRARHITLAVHDFVVDDELLTRSGRSVDDVPAAEEVVVLNSLGNVHAGAECVDVTDIMHPELRQLAIQAKQAIPGLGVAGVDLFAPDVRSPDGVVVLEVGVGANIRIHQCPTYGQPRNVAGAIIDEMIATARHP